MRCIAVDQNKVCTVADLDLTAISSALGTSTVFSCDLK